jgi:CRISPR system Cascade subunit CasE
VKREELIAWLQRKAEASGFAVDPDSLQTIRGDASFPQTGARGTLHAIEFKGELAVRDAALFRATVAAGVGSAKTFGFGLLASRRFPKSNHNPPTSHTRRPCI